MSIDMKTIDDILSKNLFDRLENIIMSTSFPWHYGRSTYGLGTTDNLYLYSWSNSVLDFTKNHRSPIFNELEPFLISALDNAGEEFKKILRCRVCLNTISPEPFVDYPHIDLTGPHKTALIYLNDSDGTTNIYNEIYDPLLGIVEQRSYYEKVLDKNVTILTTVEPKRNRFVCFEGYRFHSATMPTKTARRVLININYLEK